MRILSVRLSIKRVHCDKTGERSVQNFIPALLFEQLTVTGGRGLLHEGCMQN